MISYFLTVSLIIGNIAGDDSGPSLSAERLYNGINRPVMIEVASGQAVEKVSLALLDYTGAALAVPVEVRPGRVDLAREMPGIFDLRRAAWLQMIVLNEPAGTPLVIQPMLSRMVPRTEVRTHPTRGHPHTSIVGWLDENDPSILSPAPGGSDPEGEGEPHQSTVSRLCTGLRIYPEMDVVLHTNSGDMRFAMRPDAAPNTAWNFLELCKGGFYRGVVFHRVVPLTARGEPFVIQAGDPTATGDGGPGYWLPIETSDLPHDFGVISMARADDPDSAGSQFFVCLSREGTARLDGQYCSFGYAITGADVIQIIAGVELADIATGRPVDPPVITSSELVRAPPRVPGTGRPDHPVTPESKPVDERPTRVPR